MNSKRVIPFLMLHKGLLYKSKQFGEFNYIGDPLVAVKIFNEKEAQEICLVDTDISRNNGKINFDLLRDIAGECFMPLSYGGGVKTIEDIRKLNRIGFEKIILNSVIHENPDFVKQASTEFGTSTIIGGIDFRKQETEYLVFSHGGNKNTGKTVEEMAKFLESSGAGELLLNDIDRDGTMKGLDLELIENVSKMVSIPVIASGGVSDLNSIKEGFASGADAVAAGSLFVYKGPLKAVLINYPDRNKIESLNTFNL